MSWCKTTMSFAGGVLLLAACDRAPTDRPIDAGADSLDAVTVAPPLPDFSGEWRVARVVRAPWITDTAIKQDARAFVGRAVEFDSGRVQGPGVLSCTGADHIMVELPVEGLFEGRLREVATAASSAAQLGIELPARAVRLTCSTGSFDFVRVDSVSMLLALDNQIFTLVRTPSTEPAASAVQQLLEAHFASDMAFDRTRTAQKRAMISPTLWLDMQAYFARPVPADEPPLINGDPFTNAQEYPTRFAVTRAESDGAMSRVQVTFRDAYRATDVWYVLERINSAWLLRDIEYDGETTLRTLLRP